MPFTAPLEIRKTRPEQWEVLRSFSFVTDLTEVYVPRGFITDLASVPKALRSVVSGRGYWDQPAVLHDYLYRHNLITRKEADRLLLEACEHMEELWNVPWYRQRKRAIYAAVRVGGWFSW